MLRMKYFVQKCESLQKGEEGLWRGDISWSIGRKGRFPERIGGIKL